MPKKILIVDDERNVAEILGIALQGGGYETVCAYNGIEALEKVRGETPDLVILDIMMPEIDGWRVLEILKTGSNTSGIPVIVCTTKEKMGDVERAMSLGAKGYIIKPFDIERVIKKVGEII